MSYQVLDTKLKTLIHACKETGNHKKIADVSFILISNRINEIGLNLGVRPRNKSSGEKMFEYMECINKIFVENINVPIFQASHIEILRQCEILFLKNKGYIPLEYIRNMFSIYYELRKLEVPNLHKSIDHETIIHSSKLGAFSMLSAGTRLKKNDSDALKPLILQKITEKERFLRKNLQNDLNSQKFETIIHLHTLKKSMGHEKKGKITIRGVLKDNINYQRSIDSIFGYFILGLILLFTSLGIIILCELSFLSIKVAELSSWVLVFFTCGTILIYFYIKQFRNGRS
jgi:hypothetical protein